MLSAYRSSSWHRFPLSPYESAAGRGVLLRCHPRPWPVANPRTLRVPAHKVHVHAASGTPFQTKKMFLRSRAPSRSSSLSSTSVLGRSSFVSQQPKSCSVPAPFSRSSTQLFVSSLPTLPLQGKPLCGLCLYSCSSRLSGKTCQSTFAAHSAPFGRCVPLITTGLFATFFQKLSKRPSATKAKGNTCY